MRKFSRYQLCKKEIFSLRTFAGDITRVPTLPSCVDRTFKLFGRCSLLISGMLHYGISERLRHPRPEEKRKNYLRRFINDEDITTTDLVTSIRD